MTIDDDLIEIKINESNEMEWSIGDDFPAQQREKRNFLARIIS